MELDRWKQFVLRELGPSMEAAHHQILVYRSYVEAMNSPGHLFVTKLGQTLGRSWLGRRVRRAVNFVSALRAA